ncbi:hypothetical protein [Streptomyces sp. SM12]|uniref:hypothetical protein n=1 Tax=Streptomyces sp. SM12 TaxID=1071602 RepID=UPI000CD52454|nr:hypothetical protein [Streptomyces sp. SM12]
MTTSDRDQLLQHNADLRAVVRKVAPLLTFTAERKVRDTQHSERLLVAVQELNDALTRTAPTDTG